MEVMPYSLESVVMEPHWAKRKLGLVLFSSCENVYLHVSVEFVGGFFWLSSWAESQHLVVECWAKGIQLLFLIFWGVSVKAWGIYCIQD